MHKMSTGNPQKLTLIISSLACLHAIPMLYMRVLTREN